MKESKFGAVKRHLGREWQLYLMLLPLVVWYLVFAYKPMYGLQVAFRDFSLFKGIWGSEWVGLEHFRTLLDSELFLRAIKNTFALSSLGLLFGFPAPILLAMMFNEIHHHLFRRVSQTIVYLPHFISVVIIAGMVITLTSPGSGVINVIMRHLGFEPIYFMTRAEWFRPIYISSSIWKEAGFESIIYLAAIAGINPALYESARVDGASRWQMMWKITLPSIIPTILIMLIIRIGNLVEVGWEYVILLYQPATYETADVISTYIYRAGLQSNDYDLAAAAGLFNAVIAFVLVFTANKISRRMSKSSLW